jgi:hypothetical protein
VDISNTPSGSIAATNVQAAVNELNAEKAPIASPSFTGDINSVGPIFTSGTYSYIRTHGADASILTYGLNASILTYGLNAHIQAVGGGNIETNQGQFIGAGTGITGTAASLTAGTVTTINGRITAGANVTISGAGTAVSPYSIAASGTAYTAGTGLTLTGSVFSVAPNTYATTAQGAKADTALQPLLNGTTAQYRKICFLGTSITDAGNSIGGAADSFRMADAGCGHSGWTRHLLHERIVNAPRNNMYGNDMDHGYSGWTLRQLLDGQTWSGGPGFIRPMDDAYAANADCYVLEGGTNGLAGLTAATIIAQITEYWTWFRSRNKPVIALDILPLGTAYAPWTTSDRDKVMEVNAALPAIAASLGVTLIPTHPLVGKDVNGFVSTDYLWDGVHPSGKFALAISQALAAVLLPHTVNLPESLIPSHTSALWLNSVSFTPGATRPAPWSHGLGAGVSAAYSAQTDGDGTKWQRVALSGGSGYPGSQISIYLGSGFTVGTTIRGSMRIRGVSAGWDARSLRVNIDCWNGAASYSYAIQPNNNGTGVYDPVTGLFTTPDFLVPAGTTQIQMICYLEANAATFDVRQFGMYRLPITPN